MDTSEDVLIRHVRESNAIEGIFEKPGHPLFDGHLAAARLAAKGKIVHPNEFHRLLLKDVPGQSHIAGRYRRCKMWVGHKQMPRWRHVPKLMDEWWRLVQQYTKLDSHHEEAARLLHDWFLCIHPHEDGNGRTARLEQNNLLVHKDLPWHVTFDSEREFYYANVEAFEDGVFKKDHPDVY